MDEYGNDDGWTSNYDENSYYSPDDQYQSVSTVSGDSSYDLPNTYDEPNTYGYGNNNLGTWGQVKKLMIVCTTTSQTILHKDMTCLDREIFVSIVWWW
ncbi:MAG: hypothetical protein IPJ48_17780 [Propionivibrio sp.]|uniref:Uncharacterized protein n=1 Tax=Candidatus Propionivibrio dominans TaxID=2954373 RepID=A0A9D7FEA4_9RHOO|nr:hypothetical protein [Candidatus Propionivibrio dominans]